MDKSTNKINDIETVITSKIYLIRGVNVMIDSDLAALYGVETKRLNEQVKRNPERFPEDFMFVLSDIEFENLKSQFATSSWGGRRSIPYAFSEHGVLMLSSVLNSDRAIKVNIRIMRILII
ncbi:MAG: ORF6N domain-containing protein [Bacteroidales bacterium]|nr:ORF6N domain-containing protein [Bacteroidales bacterium]MCF8390295.1 ORF6N domain-containing protein [Bacteroidales bacterium]